MGLDIQFVCYVCKFGIDGMLVCILEGVCYYLIIDIDVFDFLIVFGMGILSYGGFLYYEVLEFIDGLVKCGQIVGIDFVEVVLDYDLIGFISIFVVQILMNIIGCVLYQWYMK